MAGNERNWGIKERPFTASRDQRWFRVGKWVFTEAQMGKDDLDCHFSFVRRCFEQYLNVSKMKMTAPAHMYEALTHPTLSIANTNVLLGNTKHDTLAKKCVLPKLKVQSVHEYEYVFTSNKSKVQEVRVRYHGGIETAHMQHVFKTDQDMYKQWLQETMFKPTECTIHGDTQMSPGQIERRKQSLRIR